MTAAPKSELTPRDNETTRLLPLQPVHSDKPGDRPVVSVPSFFHTGRSTQQLDLETSRHNYHRSILWHVCVPILFLEFSLWVATSTLTGSVFIYLRKHLGISSVRATELNYALQTLTNLAPIAGGYLADQYFGRFTTYVP